MTKCKNPSCDKEVVSVPGRRPKEFCSVECRTKFHNSKNAKGTGRGRPKGSKNKPNAIDKIEAENRTNPLTQAARGRDSSGVNEDEKNGVKKYGDITMRTKGTKEEVDAAINKAIEVGLIKPQMPKGLNWKEQLEWRRNNK